MIKDLHICDICGLISSDIKPDTTLYDKSYYRKYERYADTPLGKKILNYRLKIVRAIHVPTSLLDYGCGVGEFHNAYGNGAEGFDINPFGGFCNTSPLLYFHMIVTFWDSFEHTKEPIRLIKGFNPKYIFISTPCYDDYINGSKLENIVNWHHYYPGEHVYYFNEVSLRTLLNKCGYNIVYKGFGESEYRKSGGEKNIITIGGMCG